MRGSCDHIEIASYRVGRTRNTGIIIERLAGQRQPVGFGDGEIADRPSYSLSAHALAISLGHDFLILPLEVVRPEVWLSSLNGGPRW